MNFSIMQASLPSALLRAHAQLEPTKAPTKYTQQGAVPLHNLPRCIWAISLRRQCATAH
jgi:hypothetical protein